MDSRLVSRFCKNPALYAFKWPGSALLRPPGLFLKNKKVCTCFVTAATAVPKLLAALRYLWGLRSAMAESFRGKLVLFFFKNCISDTKTRTRVLQHVLRVCRCGRELLHLRGLPVLYSCIHIQYIYIDMCVSVCVCVLSLVCGDLGKSRVNVSG